MPECPPNDRLSALLRGTVPDADAALLDTHFLGCPACLRRLDALSDSPRLAAWLGGLPARPLRLSPFEPSERPDKIGRVGRYLVEAEIGRGGMGVVYRAWDEDLLRPVALKVLRADREDERSVSRFVRESQAAAKVRHDHLVPVFGIERTATGQPVIVMPFIVGPTLRERLRREPPLTAREAAEIVRQIADGLGVAHAAGLVHRDVKPANIMLDTSDGRAKLADFGLARQVESGDTLTCDGDIVGTPEYLSPEQIHSPGAVGARSDIYAVGVTLYECLTGVPPFRGTTLALLRTITDNEPVPPHKLNAAVPRDLESVVLKCLEKQPGARYASAAALRDDLDRYLHGRPVVARPPNALTVFTKWVRRNRSLAGLSATLALVLVAGSITSVVLWQRAERHASLARDKQRDAEQNLRAALGVVDRFCTRVSEEELLRQPGMQQVRKKLLGDAVDHYRGFVTARQNDPASRADVAAALGRLSRVTSELGGFAEATTMRREALALHQQLLADDPENTGKFADVAHDRLALSVCLRQVNDHPAAVTEGVAAAELYAYLGDDYRAKQAEALNAAAQSRVFANQSLDTQIAQFQKAVKLLHSLLKESPDDLDVKAMLAGTLQSWASARMASEDIPKLERARTLFAEVAASKPDSIEAGLAVASVDLNLGVLYKWGGRLPEAAQAYRNVITAFDRVVEENPKVTAWRRTLARSHYNLARLHLQESQHREAVVHYEFARRHFDILRQADRNDIQMKMDVAFAVVGLSAAHFALANSGVANELFEDVVPVVRSVVVGKKSTGRQLALSRSLVKQCSELAYKLNRDAVAESLHQELLICEIFLNDPYLSDQHIDAVFVDRAEVLHELRPGLLPGLLKSWKEKLPQSVDAIAHEARQAAEVGNEKQARALFEQAKANGWKPPEDWLRDSKSESYPILKLVFP